jgi:hypothetical protein
MFLGSLQRRAEWKAAIAADARRLMESFHEYAYFEARERVRAAASMARARRAIGPQSSSRLLGAKGLRSASPAPTCAREHFLAGMRRTKTCERGRRLKCLPIARLFPIA